MTSASTDARRSGRADVAAAVASLRVRELVGPSVDRAVELIGIRPAVAWAALAGLVLVGAAGIAFVTWAGLQVLALGAVAALVVVLVSFRWPLVPLFLFVALTPVEELVVIGPFGSLSRYGEILFILAYGLPRLGRLRIRAMPLTAYGFVIWATLSVGWAIDRTVAATELPVLGLLYVTAVVVAALVSERPSIVRPLIWTYSASAVAVGVLGLAAFLTSGAVTGPNDRAAAFQDQNPAYYAAILLPAFVFAVNELLNGRTVLVSAAVTAVTAGAILASGTRAAWVGAAIAVVVFVLPRLSVPRRLAAIGVAGAVAIGVLQFSGLTTLIVDRAVLALSTGGAGRTDIWTVGLTIYESEPLTGVGLANFPVAYTPAAVRNSDVGAYSADNPAYRAPHNIAIGTLAELGPIGLLLLAGFLAPLSLRRGWGPNGPIVQAIVASLVVNAFFLDIVNRKQFWLFLAIACGLAVLRRERGLDEADDRGPRWGSMPSVRRVIPDRPPAHRPAT